MKIAVAGKGGTGKSTLAAGLALLLAEQGQRVLAVDADPVASLAAALGVPAEDRQAIVPIAKQTALVEERTGAKPNQYGQMFKLNPEVADIAEKYAVTCHGVALLVLGAVERGGSGCACAENTLLRALVADLILNKDEVLIMDMEAGVEHLGRATTSGVDIMLIMVEPGQQSIDCALRIKRMAAEIGLKNFAVIANKVSSQTDVDFIAKALPGERILASLPYSEELRTADRNGISVLAGMGPALREQFRQILDRLAKG